MILARSAGPPYNPPHLALTPGTRLGPYEITAQIGVGGMGEVYRATDTNLKRQVAIKVLPASVAGDTERLARFQREAEVLAALNHPHIAAIYGLEKAPEFTALVMELVEGDDLSHRIAKGAIPVDEALPIAKQIAEALEAAHEQGIIHRDLKPANIKVRSDGTVKVLDFGLAKAIDEVGSRQRAVGSETPSMAPTITTPAMTQAGMILGTAAYMSPEQARGKAVDKRADIWAFGAVLFEMLTGTRAFAGDDIQDTFVAIMRDEPNWTRLPAALPPRAMQVMRACLQKNPKQRLDSAQAVRLALEGAFDSAVSSAPVVALAPPRPLWRRPAVLVAVASLLTAVVVGLAAWGLTRPAGVTPPGPTRVALVEPRIPTGGAAPNVALSHDGRTLVFSTGGGTLYRRDMGQFEAVVIPGSRGATDPVFSPDGQQLAFSTNPGDVWTVPLSGGPVTAVVKGTVRGVSWGADNRLLVGQLTGGLAWVPATGGETTPVTTLQAGEQGHRWPVLLPGDDAALFTVWRGGPQDAQIAVVDLSTGEHRVLTPGTLPRLAPSGHLVFAREGGLWAVPFDIAGRVLTGTPVPVLDGFAAVGIFGAAQYAIGGDGSLVYLPGTGANRTMVWADRRGRETPIAAEAAPYADAALSPDGMRVAVRINDATNALWIYDLMRNVRTRLTFEADGPVPDSPRWSPDGSRVAFGTPLMWKRADGAGGSERLDDVRGRYPYAFTPDGSALVFGSATGNQGEVGVLPLAGNRTAGAAMNVLGRAGLPVLSRDGRWLAYVSTEGGRGEVFVRPFPDVNAGKWQVSSAGGSNPRWSPAGNELFYRSGPTGMMALAFGTEPTFTPGTVTQLFPWPVGVTSNSFDVAPDGQRFLLLKDSGAGDAVAQTPRIMLVLNWADELKRLAPTN